MLLDRYPKEFALDKKHTFIIRPMRRIDEDAVLDFFTTLNEEDHLYLRNDVTNPRVIRSWFQNIDYNRVLPLLVVIDEEVVANGTLHRKPFSWMRHLGGIRIVVAPNYRRFGLARTLAGELFDNAMDEGLEKLTAEVMQNQKVALKAFSSLGFYREAVLKDYVLDANGTRHNLVQMTMNIGDSAGEESSEATQ